MNHRILAIEDDKAALANLRDILELDGYEVTGAGTLKEATEHHNWSEYPIILLDRKLPDGSADSILPSIQAAAPRTAVIVTTGYADLDGTIAALRSGASDYLIKPINADLLRAAVARVMKMRDMEERMLQSERLASIGQMMAYLTHESGNVLARGQALVELLEDEVQGPPEAIELIGLLHQAQADLCRLYEEVRNYARANKVGPSDNGVAHHLAANVGKLMATRGQGENASIIEQTDGVDLNCEVDQYRLDQVFRNLFENSLAACADPVQIAVVCSNAEVYGRPALRISVRDNGPGLTLDQAQNVFTPFFTTKQKGTGLGMAIVKRIVDAHGGSIVVASVPVSGAEFVITLPRRMLGEG